MARAAAERSLAPLAALALCALLSASPAPAGEVTVIGAEFQREPDRRWTVSVTLEHGDSGWDHYADAWRVVDGSGRIIGTRTLYHPHEHEQPFTRSLSGIAIPGNVTTVFVEAHDTVHGWSSSRLEADLSVARDGRIRVLP